MQHPSSTFSLARSWATAIALCLSALAGPATAQTAEPVGGEFQVNSYSTGFQLYPSVAVGHDGSFVVVWMSVGSLADDSSGLSIQGQRYNSAGTAVGPQFQVNTYTTGYQRYPVVDAAANGAFVVAWQSPDQDGDGLGVFARRYASDGTPLAAEFRVATTTAGDQGSPAVALNTVGEFVIAWQDSSLDGDGSGIAAQRFASDGMPIGGEFQVNTYTTGQQTFPGVGLNDGGTFVISWQSDEQSPAHDVRSAFGTLADGRFDLGGDQDCVVNGITDDDQSRASVGIDNSGQAVVVWQDRRSTTRYDIQRRTVARSPGMACLPGDETTVSEAAANDSILPTLAMASYGEFVVVWSEANAYDVRGRRFLDADSGGGDTFVANTTPQASLRPWVDFDEGGFAVTWTLGLAADEVLAQRYAGNRLFGDGFEDGDTSGWSSSVP